MSRFDMNNISHTVTSIVLTTTLNYKIVLKIESLYNGRR